MILNKTKQALKYAKTTKNQDISYFNSPTQQQYPLKNRETWKNVWKIIKIIKKLGILKNKYILTELCHFIIMLSSKIFYREEIMNKSLFLIHIH